MDHDITPVKRIISIDAFRGFAMFLIIAYDIGGAPVFQTFTKLFGEKFASAAAIQFNYGFTEGLRFCFIPMPMFLFVVGLVIPLSMKMRLLKQGKTGIYKHILVRAMILFILGLIAGGPLLKLKFTNMPVYDNVLEYIAIGYFLCSVMVLNTSRTFQFILTALLLIVYWLIFLFIPVPGMDGGPFTPGMNLAIYIDNTVLGQHHNEGSWEVLATINFISNMLIGVLIGYILTDTTTKKDKTIKLFIYGAGMVLAGILWSIFFPVIRSLWTSTFVLETCGISTLLFAVSYILIDAGGYSKWAFPFTVIGVNSIAVYMMAHMFDFSLIGNIFVGGFSKLFPPHTGEFIQAVGALVIMWLIMYWMYIKKIFIKV